MSASSGKDGLGIREIAERVSRITAENARLLQRLAETERRFHRISRGVLRVQEEERSRISRDLHDGIGQSLTALKIQLELLEREAAVLAPAFAQRIGSARELAGTCLAEVRELSHLLRPQMLDELGLLPTLRWLARTIQNRTGIEISVESVGPEARLDPDAETLAFRVVQEAVTNAVKHSGAESVRVAVASSSDRIVLRVEDGGAGFDPESVLSAREEDSGFGVRAMRDRVHSFRGRFSLRSTPGQTVLEAEIPLGGAGLP